MIPCIRASTINRWRTIAAWSLRTAATVLAAAGAYLVAKKALFAFGTGQPEMILNVYEGVGESHSFYRGVSMLLISAALGLPARAISRWMIAMPAAGCPRCGYDVEPHTSGSNTGSTGRCPECGLDLANGGNSNQA